MIRGIHHTAISTPDLERSLAFYRDRLGFETVLDFSWPEGTENMDRTHRMRGVAGRVVLVRAGNAMLEIFQYAAPEPAPRDPERTMIDHGLIHFCLDVDDVEAEYERLRAAGMAFHCPPVDYGTVKLTYGRDPDGNVIELQEIRSDDDPLVLASLRRTAS